MTVDEQIREGLAAEPLGPRPTATERAAVERAATGVRRRQVLARGGMGALLATFVVVLAVVAWPEPPVEVQTGIAGSPEAMGPGEVPDGWTTIIEPTLGWTIAYPEDWQVASVTDQCRIGDDSTIVASAGEPPPYRQRTNGCTTERNWNDVPRDAVLFGVGYRPPRFASIPGSSSAPIPDTPFPLAVPPDDAFTPQSGGSFLSQASQQVVVGGDAGYSVTVWFGEDASDEAKADARLAITLLRPPPDGTPPTTTAAVDPSWRTVALPTVAPTGGVGELALASGMLRAEGDCLYLDDHLVVWAADEAHMVVDGDGQLREVVLDGQVVAIDQPIELGGGYHAPGDSYRPIQNQRDECLTPEVFIVA